MNSDVIQGKWKEIQGDVRKKWGKLTDDDLEQINGNAKKLEGTLQKKYGWEKDKAKKEVENFSSTHSTH